MNLEAVSSTMDKIVGALRSLHQSAIYKVNDTWAVPGAGNAKDAAIGALKTYAHLITNLDTVQREQVFAGTMAPEKWFLNAELIDEGIRYTAGLTGQWSFAGVVEQTLKATGDEVKELAQPALFGAGVGGALAVAVAVLVLLIAWRIR